MAMIFPKYDNVFELPHADYEEWIRYLKVDTVSKRHFLSSVKVIAFALSAIVIAIVFESRLHIF
ncbi:hypothetical protein PRIPAC_83618 [Pristionchus pacificus]|uniref:Uncharacterized protein n=1 Tax=Pristionchus pacificus TaxID=54126 RepID=A0A2A6BV41_PRIPA|nr:hypothetical protein PRIPAC_83618 [Pristionchus pacificus]|eukprot:PDM69727.1 hypothetical protein PRIPAC_44823 [Pristionchus pacificus]